MHTVPMETHHLYDHHHGNGPSSLANVDSIKTEESSTTGQHFSCCKLQQAHSSRSHYEHQLKKRSCTTLSSHSQRTSACVTRRYFLTDQGSLYMPFISFDAVVRPQIKDIAFIKMMRTLWSLLLIIMVFMDGVSARSIASNSTLKTGRNSMRLSMYNITESTSTFAPGLDDDSDILTSRRLVRRRRERAKEYQHYQRLYTRNKWFIEMRNNGKIKGTDDPRSKWGVLEFVSVGSNGQVAIKGVESNRWLGMDRKGRIVGMEKYHENYCRFEEGGIEAGFFTYHRTNLVKTRNGKVVKQDIYLGFDKKGRPKRGRRVTKNHVSAHLLKRSVSYPSYQPNPQPKTNKKRTGRKKKKDNAGRKRIKKKSGTNNKKRQRKKNETS